MATRQTFILAALAVLLAACDAVPQDGDPCEWTEETRQSVDLQAALAHCDGPAAIVACDPGWNRYRRLDCAGPEGCGVIEVDGDAGPVPVAACDQGDQLRDGDPCTAVFTERAQGMWCTWDGSGVAGCDLESGIWRRVNCPDGTRCDPYSFDGASCEP